ncbi:MAG: 50S ribosomal protein L11 methyltransferase [Bacteroidetes bacterium]|nr:50S ribosomal protein L11 methyltransferase [Bacteroidota bacterium]
MDYVKVTFYTINASTREILIALLSNEGFEGFEETDEKLDAYISLSAFDKETVQILASEYDVPFELSQLGKQNWNAEWEKNFQPVVIDDFCTIRADFHNLNVTTQYEIVITPKMSFGTGHHATTRLMMQLMRDLDLKDKTVLDFGTGTGVLAIMAEKLGAKNIVAIDNDEWSVENSIENAQRNNCHHISIHLGSIENAEVKQFDIILANINRHILLRYMTDMYQLLPIGGKLLMSGLLKEDDSIVTEAAIAAGFRKFSYKELNNWVAILFER